MPKWRVADAHVDVLWRMQNEGVAFYQDTPLQAGFERLRCGGVGLQVFALFVMPNLEPAGQLEAVLGQLDLFYERVVRAGHVRSVLSQADLQLAQSEGSIAAVLSVEGGGCLRGQVNLLRTLYRLGVRGMGLTWNHANELADGCREVRGAGLTGQGREVVQEMKRLGMWVDIAHLADAGVADVFAVTDGPVMASHANSRHVCRHPRNLEDEVIRELIRRRGWMGLTFEGSFVAADGPVTLESVFRHLDHVLRLGGEDCVGLGSDFDGTSNAVQGLESAADYAQFQQQLVYRYGDAVARKILYENLERFLGEAFKPPSGSTTADR